MGSQEPSIFDMPLPEHERVAVDLTKHLVADEQPPQVHSWSVVVPYFYFQPYLKYPKIKIDNLQ